MKLLKYNAFLSLIATTAMAAGNDASKEEHEHHQEDPFIGVLGANKSEDAHAAMAVGFLEDAQAKREASEDSSELELGQRRAAGNNRPKIGGKRLKLYCERGYFWQERRKCKDFCLEVDGKGEAGDKLRIEYCNRSDQQKFKLDGRILRPASNRRLCVAGDELRKCDTRLRIIGGSRFEIHNRKGLCFTNSHQPEKNELVRFQECRKARNSNSNLWRFVN